MWLRVGDGQVKVMVKKRILERYKENVEEQKDVLNEGQQCTEALGSKKAQEILIAEAVVDIARGSCPHRKLPSWAVAPRPD